MTTQLTPTATLFQDDFAGSEMNPNDWVSNHWIEGPFNPSYLGLTQMRKDLPITVGGVAKFRLDTWLSDEGGSGLAFSGSEAITQRAFDLTNGGVAFEGKFSFNSTQAGMILGFFAFQQFDEGVTRNPHDELDFEILTAQLSKISTNVFLASENSANFPISTPMNGSFADMHTYRMEWLPGMVRWFVDGQLIRTDTEHIPVNPMQLHINIWGVPGSDKVSKDGQWLQSLGDSLGPKLGDPAFVPPKDESGNQTYYFDVSAVRVYQLSTMLGDDAPNTLSGTVNGDGIEGRGGDDTLNGLAGDDTLYGAAGNDTLTGGEGNDTAVFRGLRSQYTVTANNGVVTVTDNAGTDGTDTLTGVEFVNFRDALYEVVNGNTTTTLADYGRIDRSIHQEKNPGSYPNAYVQQYFSVSGDGVLTPVNGGMNNAAALVGSTADVGAPLVSSAATDAVDELVLFADAYTTLKGQTLAPDNTAGVLANDSSGSPITVSLVDGPSHGTLNLAEDGTFTYLPNKGFFGIDKFVYSATDTSGQSGESAAFINVVPVAASGAPTLDVSNLSVQDIVGILYAGILGRAADLDGFLYWAQQQKTAHGRTPNVLASFHDLANSFAESQEAKANFALLANPQAATGNDIASFLDGVYLNLFGRSADAGGKAYWSDQIQQAIASGRPLGSIVASIVSGARDQEGTHDITALINKTWVNLEYVDAQFVFGTTWAPEDRADAAALLKAVTADPLSVLSGIKQADLLVLADAI